MSRVEIEAGGRRVVIEHDTELAHITAAARDLWDHTVGVPEQPGAAYRFNHVQRPSREVGATNGGRYTNRPFAPVTAREEDQHD